MAHLKHTSSSCRTPFGNEPREGDYLSMKQDGEDWPVVICDEEIIQTFFTRSPRPGSARQADGSWGKDYKAGGFSISGRRFPALCLGTLKLVWAALEELEPIDIDMGRAIRESTTRTLLAQAWMEYIEQYKADKIFEWKNLDHWKARLHAQPLDNNTPVRTRKERLPTGDSLEGRKRKGMPESKFPPGYQYEESDDEETDFFLPKDATAWPKIKQECNPSMSSEEMDALYSDPEPPYPASSQSSKRSKLDVSGHFSMRPSTPSRAGTGKLATPMPIYPRYGTPLQSANKKLDVNDLDMVIIYVDNPHRMFKVKRSGLDASPLLSKLVMCHPQNGWYIMSPILSALEAGDFQPIGEYIDRGEYHPNILDDNTAHVRLEGDLTPDRLRNEVVRCGTVYQVAQMLEMPGLQDLAFRKLKALTPHYQAPEMLTVIEAVFDIGGPEIRQYLTQLVADHFWKLVLADTEKMMQVMGANEELAKGVHGKLSGREAEGVEVKGENVKEEEKEEVKTEGELGGKPEKGGADETNNVAKADGVGNEGSMVEKDEEGAATQTDKETDQDGEADEDVNRAELEMVKMALRRSEEERTDGDWTQLVQKQSDLFEAF